MVAPGAEAITLCFIYNRTSWVDYVGTRNLVYVK